MFHPPLPLPLPHPPSEKGSSRQTRERSRANLSFRRGAFLLNKVGFKTQAAVASAALTLSASVMSQQAAQPAPRGPGLMRPRRAPLPN